MSADLSPISVSTARRNPAQGRHLDRELDHHYWTGRHLLDADMLALVANHRLDTSPMTTHRFTLNDFETAYNVFSGPGETGALKVLLTASHG